MVFLSIPPNLTEEEELLQQKFAKLKKKKKALAASKAPKVEKQESITESLKRPPEAAADATEQAKKLLKSGAIKVEHDRRDQQTFKRTKRQKDTDKSSVGFYPFTHATGNESGDEKAEIPKPKQKYRLYDNFISASDNNYETPAAEQPDRRQAPRRGNTVYVRARTAITEEILQTAFANISGILNITVESEKGRAGHAVVWNCGFVTFETMESADQAVSEVNGAMVSGILLKVSIARHQPQVETVSTSQHGSNASWSSIAASSAQKGSHHEKRDLVTYDDEEIF